MTETPPPPITSRASEMLQEGQRLIDGDRDAQHGNRFESLAMTAALWSAYLGHKIEPHQVGSMMNLMKIGRTVTGAYNRDNYVDGAAWLCLGGELAEKANAL